MCRAYTPQKLIWANRAAPTFDDTRHVRLLLFCLTRRQKFPPASCLTAPAPYRLFRGTNEGGWGKAGEGEGEGEGEAEEANEDQETIARRRKRASAPAESPSSRDFTRHERERSKDVRISNAGVQ